MMHRAWCSIVEVPYRFSRSYVKFQGRTALKIVEFEPNWAFPDCNSSLKSPMATKCCTKLETAKERWPIVFQGHPSNFKVTRDKTSPILTQIGRFRTIGRSQLSNPSDLPCLTWTSWRRINIKALAVISYVALICILLLSIMCFFALFLIHWQQAGNLHWKKTCHLCTEVITHSHNGFIITNDDQYLLLP